MQPIVVDTLGTCMAHMATIMATENTSALFTESISACTIAGTVVISEALATALLVSLVIATTDEALAVATTDETLAVAPTEV